MRRLPVDPDHPAQDVLSEAARVLREGGLVAFPTETVYGLAADAGNAAAVERLYRLKGRNPNKAMALLVGDRESIEDHVQSMPRAAQRLIERFWPGPVTLVVPGRGGKTIGLRMPSLAVARKLPRAAGFAIAQTSANESGAPPALCASEVGGALGDAVDLVLDGGRVPSAGKSSTVVRCEAGRFEVLRAGEIANEDIIEAATDLVLFACTGNICRSPIAEAVMRHELAERRGCAPQELLWHGFRCGSFGTMAMVGYPASENSIVAAREFDIDISAHRSKPFSIGLLESAYRVYCLARSHMDFLGPYFAGRDDAIELLRAKGKDIRDPYGRSLKTYRKVADQIRKACGKRAAELSSGD